LQLYLVPKNTMKNINFKVDTRLARLLSENYRSTEKAIKELVDNAWDADSELVEVFLPEPLTTDPIIVQDNGSGMTEQEILKEYLAIASDRRKRRGEFTLLNRRKVKGRKGIGKFAGFMAADEMKLETWVRGKKCQFSFNTSQLDNMIDIEDLPIELEVSECNSELHGTRITLLSLRQSLTFPSPDRLRQLLLQEYGRENGFLIFVNDKQLGVEDVKGSYSSHRQDLQKIGLVNLNFTVLNHQEKMRSPGISIRVDGKIVGNPSFFGLDQAEDFPSKLLNKIYGEIEVDGLYEDVTADWGALVENSDGYRILQEYVQPILRQQVKEQYEKEISLAQARLQRNINLRLSELPEYKREYADKSIKKILGKYYGEPESKVASVVSVLLDAIERTDYRAILDYIHEAEKADIARLAEILTEFGLVELAILGEQATSRLEFLSHFERLCQDDSTKESLVHTTLEKALWVFGAEYSFFSSNKTLGRQVEECLGKKYSGKRSAKRPDLLLTADYANRHLLIEFKRPSHTLSYSDYQQATAYRNDFRPYINHPIDVLLVGGRRGHDLPVREQMESQVTILIFDEIISRARNQLNWLLKELGGESHA